MILTPPPTGGQQILRHALARRWVSIVAGTLAGLVVGVGAALVVPVSHSATVSMTVTAPALTPAPTVRASLSNTTDMVTERGIATSAAVLDVAAARLGNGVSAADLRANVEVSGDTNGTIVNIEYVADTRDQAVDAADAIANAYLTERTALVEQRADEIAASINEQISVLEAELASLAPVVDEAGNAKDNPRAAEIRTELTKLAKDAEQLTPYHATAGRVITPAAASDDEVSPSKLRLVLIMTVVGIFAGLVMVLVRETRSRSLASPTQLADLTALPVWSAEEGAPEPWLAPTRMLAMAIDRDHWVDLIVDASDPQARDLHRVLSASLAETRVPAPRLIDIKQPLASLLNEVRPSRHVLVAVRKGHDLKALHALLDELAIINREVNGMIYLGDQVAPVAPATSTPAPAAEVIVPAHYNGTTHEVAVGVPTKETENTANTTGAKNADTAGTSFVKKGEK